MLSPQQPSRKATACKRCTVWPPDYSRLLLLWGIYPCRWGNYIKCCCTSSVLVFFSIYMNNFLNRSARFMWEPSMQVLFSMLAEILVSYYLLQTKPVELTIWQQIPPMRWGRYVDKFNCTQIAIYSIKMYFHYLNIYTFRDLTKY